MVGENWFQHLPRNSSEIIYPPGNVFPYPTERESRKIIDFKCAFGREDMLVPRRVDQPQKKSCLVEFYKRNYLSS